MPIEDLIISEWFISAFPATWQYGFMTAKFNVDSLQKAAELEDDYLPSGAPIQVNKEHNNCKSLKTQQGSIRREVVLRVPATRTSSQMLLLWICILSFSPFM